VVVHGVSAAVVQESAVAVGARSAGVNATARASGPVGIVVCAVLVATSIGATPIAPVA
jgi:hypothetical protein